jgi:putative ABC transport system permease protein
MLSDIRHAFRVLVTTPAFTALIVVVLGLGIGANTAIFSIVYGVLLKPLPFSDPSRLVVVQGVHRGDEGNGDNAAYPDFADWKLQATTIDPIAGYATGAATMTGAGEATSIDAAFVTPELLPLLGVHPSAGRTFRPEDGIKRAAPVALISENLWRRRFDADPFAVGRSVTLDGTSFTIVGVMPAQFEFPYQADRIELWLPMSSLPFTANFMEQRGASFMNVVGRLRPGATVEQANAELAAIAKRLAETYPQTNASRGARVRPLQDDLVANYRRGLMMLLYAVAAVLLIACANVANLLLARGAARQKEIAIRAALGAGRGRIVRQLLIESLVLSLAAGLAGVLFAMWGVAGLVAASPIEIPRLHAVDIDGTVLGFTMLVSGLTGVLFGVAPAFHLAGANAGETLKDAGRGSSGARSARTRHGLVVAEVALSLVLLTAAGLLVRSFMQLQRVDPGFVPQRAVAMSLLLPGARYPTPDSQVAFYHRLVRTAASGGALPGAESIGIATTLPMSGSDLGLGFTIEGRPAPNPGDRPSAGAFAVSPDYFRTMGIPIRRGRGFTARDDEKAPKVMIVSETLARRHFPGEDPVGKRITIGYRSTSCEIVGVVADVKTADLSEEGGPQIYTPFPQTPWPFMAIAVRTASDPLALAGPLRRMLMSLDPDQPGSEVTTIEQYLSRAVATPRFNALLIASFAGLALFLAACGLYGVMSYSVAQRRREIGIRMALGAQPGDVRGMVVSQALAMGLAGLGIGLVAAFLASRLLDNLLFEVNPADPATFAVVSVMLLAVVLAAAYLPARRATRVDPILALRAE